MVDIITKTKEQKNYENNTINTSMAIKLIPSKSKTVFRLTTNSVLCLNSQSSYFFLLRSCPR